MPKPPLEKVEQKNFVNWLRDTRPDIEFFHVPNGSPSAKRRRFHASQGVSPGVPDLFLFRPLAPVDTLHACEAIYADMLQSTLDCVRNNVPPESFLKILIHCGVQPTLAIEMKRQNGYGELRDTQAEWGKQLRKRNIPWHMAEGDLAAREVVEKYFGKG